MNDNMNKPKRIKISEIEENLLDVSCGFSKIESLAHILYECLCNGDEQTLIDSTNLTSVMCDEIKRLKDKLAQVEKTLCI